MGKYLNPGNENFRDTLAGKRYVDKTGMLDYLNHSMNTEGKYVCVSRPRRFGKTIAGNMLAAYYSRGCKSDELFSGYEISRREGYKDHLNKYNVIQIDVNGEYQNAEVKTRVVKNLIKKIKDELRDEFTQVKFPREYTLADMMLQVYLDTGVSFVVILDEYDVLVRENVKKPLFDEYLGFLNGLFKSNTLKPAISLAYLTGILPIVRDKVQSKLNNFSEYTFLDAGRLSSYVGFTVDEVRKLCAENGMDFDECRRWYDGYRVGEVEVYNPESVIQSMANHKFANYWCKTASYEAITDLIKMDHAGLQENVVRILAGENVKVNVTRFLNTMNSFKNDSDVFTFLTHLGYLSYDESSGTCHVPNKEVRNEWLNAIEEEPRYAVTDAIIKASDGLLESTIKGDELAVAKALDVSHVHVTSNRSYNNEDALQSAIYLAYVSALNKYAVVREMTAGKGFADMIFIPYVAGLPAMIIELKHNKTAGRALAQIKEKKYFEALNGFSGEILFVGINYDEKKKSHDCRIEKFVK